MKHEVLLTWIGFHIVHSLDIQNQHKSNDGRYFLELHDISLSYLWQCLLNFCRLIFLKDHH